MLPLMLAQAAHSAPQSTLVWLAIAAGVVLVLWHSGGDRTPVPQSTSRGNGILDLPFTPAEKLEPAVDAFRSLKSVDKHLDAKGLGAEAQAHIDALAALINRKA